jgi:hypothetical protein
MTHAIQSFVGVAELADAFDSKSEVYPSRQIHSPAQLRSAIRNFAHKSFQFHHRMASSFHINEARGFAEFICF